MSRNVNPQYGSLPSTNPENEGLLNTINSNSKLRKRTKTGCLTCRKRRIKCGEERPTCGNCIKSKRHCEGYNQRVVFKPPLGDWPGIQHSTLNTLQFHNGMLPAAASYPRAIPPPINTQDAGFTRLQPRPTQRSPYDEYVLHLQHGPPSVGNPYMPNHGLPMQSPQTPLPPAWTPITPHYSQPMFPQESPMSVSTHHSHRSQIPTPVGPPSGFVTSPNVDQNWQRAEQNNGLAEPPTPASSVHQDWKPYFSSNSLPTPGSASAQSQDGEPGHFPFRPPNVPLSYWDSANAEFISIDTNVPQQYSAGNISWNAVSIEETKPVLQELNAVLDSTSVGLALPPTNAPVSTTGAVSFVGTAADLLEQAAVEYEDDDYYDVQSDEEMEVPPDQTMIKLEENQRDFGMIMSLHRENSSELSMRRYDTFIYDGIMDHYRAEWVANPLRNPKTARVFAHFISATGPTLSIFERKPRNASAIFSETPVPNYQQGLWTYVLPMMALNHQGLLHAMLALASLHIAKLQNTSVTPSYKHYAYALKRIHHCVGNRAKRHMPTTIAATLLLGFYEVMTADHLKWSSHLAGAKQLFIEIDFKGMTKEYRRIKAEAAAQEPQNLYDDCETALQERNPNKTFKNLSLAIDESLVSTLIGRKLKYDQFGQIVEDTPNRQGPNESIPSALDTQKYELYQDLFWWYARQDVYQAIVSGNKLLLDYSRWADCPPRASMGRADAVHGTHDHLILLLGRIAEFQARDRSRKIKVMEANGGHWRPPANMDFGSPTLNRGAPLFPPAPGTSGPPGQGFGPPQGFTMGGGRGQMEPPGPPPQMPTFYGMAPSRSNAQMPSSYVIDGSNATPSPKSDRSDYDLENATQAALDEWFQIRAALNTFKSHFGPQFQPLSPELHQPTLTPFGPALQYRSYDVANLWGLYYMAYIIALRAHPHMPPAAMMAAGIAAQQTAEYTRLIGQIAGGIVPPHPGQALNPSLGASLCEISMPLFFAGVTYQHPGQRDWLVRHVRDIEARTGWASVGMIAQGCETAWIKAYEAGRGPPYQRTKEVWYVEESINDSRITRKGGHFDGVEPDPSDLSDKRWASTNAGTRVHWAMGLLSVEDDI